MVVGGREFIEVFRTRFEMIRSLEGSELMAALLEWLRWLQGSEPTAEILRELAAEGSAAVAAYGRLCAEARTRLQACASEVSAATPDVENSINERRADPPLIDGARSLAAVLDELNEQSSAPALPSTWTQFPQSPDDAFNYLVRRVGRTQSLTDHDARQALIQRVQDVQWDIQSRFTEMMFPLAGRGVHAHAAFRFLMSCVGGQGADVRVQYTGWPSIDPVVSIRAAVFGRREVAPRAEAQRDEVFPREIRVWEPLLRGHAEAVFRELAFRLLARRHLDTALHRYGVRAELYDRDRLLALADANVGKVEAVLVSDCAKYLFDCGFSVSTEVVLGNVRADIVAPDLYVEAKQVGSRDETKAKVLGAYRQALGSARRLRAQAPGVPPIALVVFQVGGTRIEAPTVVPPWLSSPAVNLYVVDLREKGQGAAEGVPVKIEQDEFRRVAEDVETQPPSQART